MLLLISLALVFAAACQRKGNEQVPVAFDEAETEAKALIDQLKQLGSDDIMQLEVRTGRLLADQRVLDNPAAEESLRTTQDFLSHMGENLEELRAQATELMNKFLALRKEWLENKENRPNTMERFFVEQQKLSDLVMQADYLVNRWNAQLMNIENFEKAFPQNMNE